MKRAIIITIIISIMTTVCFAQKGKTESYTELSLNGGLPTGNAAKNYTFGAGAAIRYVHFLEPSGGLFDFSDVMPFTYSAGVYSVFGKDTSSTSETAKAENILVFPLMIGSKFVTKNSYLAFEAGWAYLKKEKSTGAFSFTCELGLDMRKAGLALRFLGASGKEGYFIGIGCVQVSFKL